MSPNKSLLTPAAVSKRSRAARRGLIEEGITEAKALESVPKASDDVKASIIRTTIKNENLLNQKIERKHQSKVNKKQNSALKSKLERSNKVAGILGEKIEQSITRARYIQSSRKAGWDQINRTLKESKDNAIKRAATSTDKDDDQIEEDEYVEDFFKGDDKAKALEMKNEREKNAFALLDEAEA